ncbi:DUF423 domain-containing protein [Phocicoccus pinnipedialis]|uniref:DUF423 domain-containing protein n=1 Tax=Phocicoccus pinnipedialis TaxID=110845 RepID=A0A6V7R3W6_9BACL|nr:DUF423 domain-containing protein [Jeotgalicoccus pinnipedialis]MBP1940036.1 uncharacterized membrane protein YgdD (TMEM256/DUF423 family) [Jeotgalicoccus pinnipedialis]CAD2072016.1 hypothetical protein JEOPIN946_00214 [Jeotgalicoccus pinnipedialis]
MKVLIIVGAINALISVACGAFGAHGLEGKLSEHYLQVWETACRYQMYHGLGIILIGVLKHMTGIQLFGTAGWIMLVGIILFSGSLFVLALSGVKILGAVTPIGGVFFIASWVMVIIGALKIPA